MCYVAVDRFDALGASAEERLPWRGCVSRYGSEGTVDR
jgi:hypothetical protein